MYGVVGLLHVGCLYATGLVIWRAPVCITVFFWLLDFRVAGLQGFASALILRVWNCLEMRSGVGPGSPDVVSGALATEVPKCTRFWKHCCHGLFSHERISEISEPVL